MKSWFKDLLLDIIIFVALFIYAFTLNQVLLYLLWAYTSLVLVSKILVLFVDFLKVKASKSTAPNIVYHIIYFFSIGVLLYAENYYLAGAWALIWALSIIANLRNN
jgi:hypothetical protein